MLTKCVYMKFHILTLYDEILLDMGWLAYEIQSWLRVTFNPFLPSSIQVLVQSDNPWVEDARLRRQQRLLCGKGRESKIKWGLPRLKRDDGTLPFQGWMHYNLPDTDKNEKWTHISQRLDRQRINVFNVPQFE